MSAGRIIAIVLGVVLLLGVFAFGAGYYWWQTQGSKLKEESRAAMAAATEFGSATDNQGCLDESLARYHRCGDEFTCNVMNSGFFLSCLRASSPVPGFCDDVPSTDSIMGSVTWRLEQCERRGTTGTHCPNLFGQLQRYCDSSSE